MRRSIWALSAAVGFLFLGAAGRAEAGGEGPSGPRSSFFTRARNMFYCWPPTLRQSGETNLLKPDDAAEISAIGRASKGDPDWSTKFLSRYFTQRDGGSAYDPTLAHWIVFIDSDGRVHQDLVDWSRTTCSAESRTELNGVNHIWVMFFSERPMESVGVKVEQLADYRGPGATLLDSIARAFTSKGGVTDALSSGSASKTSSDGYQSSDSTFSITPISVSSEVGKSLYKAFVEVPLNANTRDRLTLHEFTPAPLASADGDNLRGIHTNFVNGEAGHLGASIAAGGTRMSGGYIEPNLFLAAHYYFPSNHYWREHIVPSAFVATNVAKESILSNIVAGGSFHNFAFSRAFGFDIGGNFIEHHKGARLFFGLDYQL